MKVVSNWRDIPGTPVIMEGAKSAERRLVLGPDDATPLMALRVFTLSPGGHTPYHRHPFEHMNYVIEGNGALVAEGREHDLKEGDFALVLPGEKHQFRNASKSQNFRLICAVPKEYE